MTNKLSDSTLARMREITPASHTAVVAAVFKHAEEVLQNLPETVRRRGGRRPTPVECLDALIAVRGIDDRIRAIAEAARDFLPFMERALPAELSDQLAVFRRDVISAGSVDGIRRIVDHQADIDASRGDDGPVAVGVQFAREILADGRTTIYSNDYIPAVRLSSDSQNGARMEAADAATDNKKSGWRHAGDIAGMDVAGAAGGAAAGAMVGGVGAGPGAGAGAVGGSVTETVSKIWDWVWS